MYTRAKMFYLEKPSNIGLTSLNRWKQDLYVPMATTTSLLPIINDEHQYCAVVSVVAQALKILKPAQ